MFKFSDILGTLMQSGMSGTATRRMQHALGSGGKTSGGSPAGLLGGGGGIGDTLSGRSLKPKERRREPGTAHPYSSV